MELSSLLKEAWKDVESVYNTGYMVNESMFAFALWKAIKDRRPKLCVTFDARIDSQKKYRPDLVIWKDGPDPSVLFVCELKFKPEYNPRYQEDIAKLQRINKNRILDVLTRNPKTGDIEALPIKKSENFGIGFFAIANWDAAAVTNSNVTQNLTTAERSIFHFAFGSIPGNEDGAAVFSYCPPVSQAKK